MSARDESCGEHPAVFGVTKVEIGGSAKYQMGIQFFRAGFHHGDNEKTELPGFTGGHGQSK
jgi:hypothetical protein